MRIDNGYVPTDEDKTFQCVVCKLETQWVDDDMRCPICAELARLELLTVPREQADTATRDLLDQVHGESW